MPRGTKERSSKNRQKKNKSNRKENVKETKETKFSFDDEIVIGLKRLDEPKIISKKNNKNTANGKKSVKRNKIKEIKKIDKKNNNEIRNIDDEYNIMIQSKYMKNYEFNVENKVKNDKIKSKRNIENVTKKGTNKSTNNSKIRKKKKQSSSIKKSNSSLENQGEKLQTININAPLSKEEIRRQEKAKRKKKIIIKLIKCFTLLAIIICGIVYAMLSPIFNIKEIEVNGNLKIPADTLIGLSGISTDQNIFSFKTSSVKENIKKNAYIDTVDIHVKLPNKISIFVTERKTTYMLCIGNAYAYVNNQGYILEISDRGLAVPILTGYSTPKENIQEGNRLNIDDLDRLNDILKIMEAASNSSKNLKNLITQIDMSDKSNYIMSLKTQKKQIYFGDSTNLSTKMLWINQILEEEKKNEGVLYLNMDLNTKRPYFREKI